MIVKPIKTEVFQECENLFSFIVKHIKSIPEKSILVITSKVVALSEGRTVVAKDERAKEKIIRKESDFAVPTKFVWLTLKDGMLMASAGIDESNANGKLILLPRDSYKTADEIRKKLKKYFGVKKIGIIITDSRTAPLRAGVTAVALGYAGFSGIKDYRGKPDIFGRKFHFSRVNVADSLATSAVFVMGEGNEQYPLAIIEDIEEASVKFREKVLRKEVIIGIEDDMYKPFFTQWRKS